MSIRRATTAEIHRLSVTAMRAFHDDPVMRWIYPDDEEYFAPGGRVFQDTMPRWLGHDEVWTTDDSVALAVWLKPGRPELPDALPEPPPPPPDRLARFELLGPVMAENTPPEEHWYLQLLATHPDWQRQGLGAALMAVQFERADAEGLPCYLETETPENVAYYQRYGFEVRTEWDVDPDGTLGAPGPHMWGMLRPSR